MKRALKFVLFVASVPLCVTLAACGKDGEPVGITVDQGTTTQESIVSTEVAEPTAPALYEGTARALTVKLSALPEGWSVEPPADDAPTPPNTPRRIFYLGPESRTKPIEPGNVSAFVRDFSSGSGLSFEFAYHLVLVYDSEGAAITAGQGMLGVLKGRPGSTWQLRKANPPKRLGENARSWQGEQGSTDSEFVGQVCLTIWRQVNIVQFVYARGLLSMPKGVCSSLAKTAFGKAADALESTTS